MHSCLYYEHSHQAVAWNSIGLSIRLWPHTPSCLVLCLGFDKHLMAASKCAQHHADQSGLPNTPLHPACLPLLPLALPTSDPLLEGRILVLPFSVCHGTGLKSCDACSQTYLLLSNAHLHFLYVASMT